MEFAVRHFMAGRLRLFVPALRRRRSLAEAAIGWLRGQPGIKRARINYECASLVVEFDPAHEPLLRALLGRLALMRIDELRMLVQHTPAHAQRTSSQGQSSVRSQPSARALGAPLALPTVSLALSFTVNPVVRAINLPLMLWNGFRSRVALGASGAVKVGSTSISSIRLRSSHHSPRATRWPVRSSPG